MEVDELFAEPRTANPHELVVRAWQSEELTAALSSLPVAFREVIILRELEDMSYKEIADVIEVPIGTVMSRLARARERLQFSLVTSGAVGAQ
jgi:RNA polymerase sigma-70 factor (ECF subfamily)